MKYQGKTDEQIDAIKDSVNIKLKDKSFKFKFNF